MSDDELERLRRRRLLQLRNCLLSKKEAKKEKANKKELLGKVFVGRAWEVFNATKSQYPKVARRLGETLVQLVSSGQIKQVSGQELYHFISRMGLTVRLNTTIRIKEHGKLKSLTEKMRE